MHTSWIAPTQLQAALQRNEAFWNGNLTDGPLIWALVPDAKPGTPPTPPPTEAEEWTNVDYVMAKAEDSLARTYYAGDALPVHNPWLGPDQVAAWLGAEITFKPRDNTSWVKPFVNNWEDHADLRLDPENRWWKLYLEILRASATRGRGKWVTCYPDLHTGIDGLAAIRGPEQLMIDLFEQPETIKRAMRQMTRLWKEIVDAVDAVVLPTGQGTTNWTLGWSSQRFICLGQNDFSCLVGPDMFADFLLEDTAECCQYADRIIYHLDGPGALQHLPRLLEIDALHCVQWIQGAGATLPSTWLDLLKRIQDAGKTVQVFYAGAHGGDADISRELEILCRALDPDRLFCVAYVDSVAKADAIASYAPAIRAG